MTPGAIDGKRLQRRLLASAPARAALRVATRVLGRDGDGLLVPMFHRTLDGDRFRDQLSVLLDGRVAVRGADVVAAVTGGPPLPPRALWVTFDDAYADFGARAWPVLRELGVPATQFVPTHFVGQDPVEFWWELLAAAFAASRVDAVVLPRAAGGTRRIRLAGRGRARAFKAARAEVKSRPHADGLALVDDLVAALGRPEPLERVRALTWDELERLHAEGLELAGHSRHHPMLDRVPLDEARAEIRGGFDDLRARFDDVLPAFAYPSGQFDEPVRRAVEEAGVPLAVTTREGFNASIVQDPLRVRRVSIGPRADRSAVRLRLLLASRRVA